MDLQRVSNPGPIILGFSVLLMVGVQVSAVQPAFAVPTLDQDLRYTDARSDPPGAGIVLTDLPPVPFGPFMKNTIQFGASLTCSSNASAFGAQNSTVAPLLYEGAGSATAAVVGGACFALAEANSFYWVVFTTDAEYTFDLTGTLDNARFLLETGIYAGGSPQNPVYFVSGYTGSLSQQFTLPADTYTVVVGAQGIVTAGSGESGGDGGVYDFTLTLTGGTQTGVDDAPRPVTGLRLSPPHPNPSVGPVNFSLDVPQANCGSLAIYDIAGREVVRLAEGIGQGNHVIRWDGRDAGGRPVPLGIYMVRAVSGGHSAVRRIVRVRYD